MIYFAIYVYSIFIGILYHQLYPAREFLASSEAGNWKRNETLISFMFSSFSLALYITLSTIFGWYVGVVFVLCAVSVTSVLFYELVKQDKL